GTIRHFNNNVSNLKNFVVHDYKDILQCAIPCFKGLLPPKLDTFILDLIFLFACWHAYAKLQLHTESSLSVFTCLTSQLGLLMQKFKQEVNPLDTHEIQKEHDARACCEINASKKKGTTIKYVGQAVAKGKISTAKLTKKFSLLTYKYHAMGDYLAMIHAFGTTDSYSTQLL
ncbi:hypothetical protein EDD18DRAFT_1091603, partial [Armillaria luteobubalina]